MLKSTNSNPPSKRELLCAKDSVKEKLRAKLRQRIHNTPREEGDENVNTLNREKSIKTRHERGKSSRPHDDKTIHKTHVTEGVQKSTGNGSTNREHKDLSCTRDYKRKITGEHQSLVAKVRGSQVHEKDKKTPTPERRGRTVENRPNDKEKCISVTSEKYETMVSSKHTETTGEENGSVRRKIHVGRRTNYQDLSESKLPVRVKQLSSEFPLEQDTEKPLKTHQQNTSSSRKRDALSSLMKLKDALQAQSKDEKTRAETLAPHDVRAKAKYGQLDCFLCKYLPLVSFYANILKPGLHLRHNDITGRSRK